jgi:hypothetical protein
MSFNKSATATGSAYAIDGTSTGSLVTSSSTASASSEISESDAYNSASTIASAVAQSVANNNANIIDQAVSIIQDYSPIKFGIDAGQYNQGIHSIAIGDGAGYTGQSGYSISIGYQAGYSNQAFDDNGFACDSIAIGSNAGAYNQKNDSIAIGFNAGFTGQDYSSVAIGYQAGYNTQGNSSVAVGQSAARYNQGNHSVAIGQEAGFIGQSGYAVAIGRGAGYSNQGYHSISIGRIAGYTDQGGFSVAIGYNSGNTDQGDYSIAIGNAAGSVSQPSNSIILNAMSTELNTSPAGTTGFFVKPINPSTDTTNCLVYNSTTGRITYANTGTGSKTFVIDHPVNPEKYLVHACLEGPEAGVYYRGKGEIKEGSSSDIIELPNYVSSFATDLTVQITPIYNGKINILNASEVENNSFTVYGESSCKFNWVVYGKRSSINTEPYKNDVNVKGSGPYLWI